LVGSARLFQREVSLRESMKIKVKQPLVEMDGDEMARLVWHLVRDHLILPYVDIRLVYFDLSLANRAITQDHVTIEAAKAVRRYHAGIKCATVTPNQKHLEDSQLGLKEIYPSPNATIRNYLGGTVFREPIIINNIPR
jgi:isocitrate dehydrogenase